MKAWTARLTRIVIALGLLALVPLVAACAKGVTSPKGEASTSGSKDVATVRLLEPSADALVSAGTVTVRVETTGLKFSMPSNTNVAGEGHVHFTLDDRPFVMSTEPEIKIDDVESGTHTLKAELVQNDTKPFDPPVEEVIEFTAE